MLHQYVKGTPVDSGLNALLTLPLDLQPHSPPYFTLTIYTTKWGLEYIGFTYPDLFDF